MRVVTWADAQKIVDAAFRWVDQHGEEKPDCTACVALREAVRHAKEGDR